MFRLLGAKASVSIWRRAIGISSRLSPASWKLLTCCSLAWLIFSYWEMKPSTSELQPHSSLRVWRDSSASQSIGDQFLDYNLTLTRTEAQLLANVIDPEGDKLLYTYTTTGGHITGEGANVSWDLAGIQPSAHMDLRSALYFSRAIAPVSYLAHDLPPNHFGAYVLSFSPSENFVEFYYAGHGAYPNWLQTNLSGSVYLEANAEETSYIFRRDQLSRFGMPVREMLSVSPRLSPPESRDFKKDILFWVSLFGLIVSPITSITTLILTWISLHRRRAEEILMRLELQKRQLEIEQLRIELERARLEVEKQRTGLIIIPG